MTDEQHIQRLLEQMLEGRLTPQQACQSRPDLLPRVRQRWERIQQVRGVLDQLLPEEKEQDESIALPTIVGYDVEALLGRGGMGVVYKAHHLKLDRPVAIKMLLAGAHAGAVELARFREEAKSVARLRHANIVQVYDVGELDGCPYFTMELVEGGSLAQQLGEPQIAQRAATMMAVIATALHAAHLAGVVHRDLKPANILLTAEGTPKVSDFGLALRFAADGQAAQLTIARGALGTPSYMAPEQAMGLRKVVGPASDVYALGAILYEMLTGRPPFRGATAVDTIAQAMFHDPVPPTRLVPQVPRDLETICLKCLQKSPERRYGSAAELADDLGRFLRGEPIHGRPVGRIERLRRWSLRHRGLAAALMAVVLLGVVIIVGSLASAAHFQRQGEAQRRLAMDNARLADNERRERAAAEAAEARESVLRGDAERQRDDFRRNLYFAEMNLASQAAVSPSGIGRVLDRLAPWSTTKPDLRDWEWFYFYSLGHRELRTFRGHVGSVVCAAWSPDGRKIATGGGDSAVVIWEAATGNVLLKLAAHDYAVFGIAWSPDGRRLATASWDSTVKTWDAETGALQQVMRGPEQATYTVAWSPDGKRLASAGADRVIRLWNSTSGQPMGVLAGHGATVMNVAWSPDGKRIASGSQDSSVRLWDVASLAQTKVLQGHANWVNSVAWDRDGGRLATASNDNSVRIWDTTTAKEVSRLNGHALGVASVTWNPDCSQLATTGDDQTIKIWDTAGHVLRTLRGHTLQGTSIAWNPNGKELLSTSVDGTVKTWDAAAAPGDGEVLTLAAQDTSVGAVAWRHDGRELAAVSYGGIIRLWNVARREPRLTLKGDANERLYSVAWSPDGTRIAAAGEGRTISLWDTVDGRKVAAISPVGGSDFHLAWSPDGKTIAYGGKDGVVRLADAVTGEERRTAAGHTEPIHEITWSPDGKRIASASSDRTVRVWDAATFAEQFAVRTDTGPMRTAAWSPDGQQFAVGNEDHTITVCSSSTGQSLFKLRGHTSRVYSVSWHPSGTRLASAGDDRTIKLWDAQSGHEIVTLYNADQPLWALTWKPDGTALAAAGAGSTVFLFEATRGYAAAGRPTPTTRPVR